MTRYYAILVLALAGMVLLLCVAPSFAQQGPTVQQQLAQCTARLSDANAQASEAQKYEYRAQSGELVAPSQFIAAFEKANPGKTLDARLAVTEKVDPVPGRPDAAKPAPAKANPK